MTGEHALGAIVDVFLLLGVLLLLGGIKEWQNERGYLRDTCLSAQDEYKLLLQKTGVK